jgi:hypothetical protein
MSKRISKKTKILNFLQKTDGVNTLTINQARALFGIGAPARIHELRTEGHSIYSNRKVLDTGEQTTVYRLGRPSVSFSRNMEAGRIAQARQSLYSFIRAA